MGLFTVRAAPGAAGTGGAEGAASSRGRSVGGAAALPDGPYRSGADSYGGAEDGEGGRGALLLLGDGSVVEGSAAAAGQQPQQRPFVDVDLPTVSAAVACTPHGVVLRGAMHYPDPNPFGVPPILPPLLMLPRVCRPSRHC